MHAATTSSMWLLNMEQAFSFMQVALCRIAAIFVKKADIYMYNKVNSVVAAEGTFLKI